MTLAHLIYIPSVLMVGLVLGWILGVKSAKEEAASDERKRRRREQRAAERAAATAGEPAAKGPRAPGEGDQNPAAG